MSPIICLPKVQQITVAHTRVFSDLPLLWLKWLLTEKVTEVLSSWSEQESTALGENLWGWWHASVTMLTCQCVVINLNCRNFPVSSFNWNVPWKARIQMQTQQQVAYKTKASFNNISQNWWIRKQEAIAIPYMFKGSATWNMAVHIWAALLALEEMSWDR